MNKRDLERCSCERLTIETDDGRRVEEVARLDDRCRAHGFPTDEWPAGHPLYQHARFVERKTGKRWRRSTAHAAVGTKDSYTRWQRFESRFRLETPRETERRLLGLAPVGSTTKDPPDRRCGLGAGEKPGCGGTNSLDGGLS